MTIAMSRQTPRLPTLFLAYALDFAIFFIQGCLSHICQSIYINISTYMSNETTCVKQGNLYISIYCLPRWEKGRMFWNSSRMSRMQSGSFFVITFTNTTNHHPSDVHSIFVTLLIMISSNIHMGSSNSCHYSSKVYLLILCLIGHYDLF